MRYYISAYFVFAIIIVVSAGGLYHAWNEMRSAEWEREDAEIAVQSAEDDLKVAKSRFGQLYESTVESEKYLKVWEEHVYNLEDVSPIVNFLSSQARREVITNSGARTIPKKNYIFEGKPIVAKQFDVSVKGEYVRVVNWLGSIQGRFRLARGEILDLSVEGSQLNAKTILVFPGFVIPPEVMRKP